ncbi:MULTISPECIES: hypothetical protein [Staphylococcus]|uniref:DUF2483 family protein n=1 Tax=Staphylococcus TaxID=1279 RepID=UPI0003C0A6D8|nr:MULTISPECIES: hypothetical protein [Staphylococcus]AGZ24982.1 hypothetical protein STP1_0671 [Staphylococcus pasteuri SP1]MCR1798289.1 hypothetical protein [Staphylococcus warneri]QNQ45168.1 hypothetical protein IAR39_03445 [Staphylococcus warneri]
MSEPIITTEVEYRVKDELGKWVINKPSAPEYANYNILRSNARPFTGLENFDVEWDEHYIEVTTLETKEIRKTYRIKDLREVQDE